MRELEIFGTREVTQKPLAISNGGKKLLARALFLLAVGFLLANLLVFWPRLWNRTDRTRDVVVYWQAARDAGTDHLYRVPEDSTPDVAPAPIYLYAPPFAALLSPLRNASFVSFARGWLLMTIAAFWLFAYCLSRLAGYNSLQGTLIAGLGLGLFPGTWGALSLGQVDPLLWVLFGIGLLLMESPWWWMIAALIKPFYAWPVLVSKPNWRLLTLSSLNIAVLLILGGMVCSWDSYATWFKDVLPLVSQGNFSPGNISLSFGVLRLLQYAGIWHYPGGPLATLPHLWLTTASIGAPALTWWMLRRQEPRTKAAAVMAAAVLFAPVTWATYLPVTLPLLVLLWGQWLRYYGGKRVVITPYDFNPDFGKSQCKFRPNSEDF